MTDPLLHAAASDPGAGEGSPPPASLAASEIASDPEQRGRGERALMCAVLADAVRCLRSPMGPSVMRPRLAARARSWMMSRDRSWPYSFENICESLGLEPDALRRRILRRPSR